MSLSNAAIVVAPTSIAPTGGTALTFSSNGIQGPGQLQLVVPADTDMRTRRTLDVTVKSAKVSVGAPNGYTQNRVSYFYRKPKLLANGKITVNTAKIEFSYDVETTQAEIQELLDVSAQICFDADFTPTTKLLSLS